jgi:AcrR family transcriptional regulator
MRASTPKTAQRPRSELDTPVKDRIVQNAHRLFIRYGVNISTDMIAHFAHTNIQTIFKYFGTRDRLVSDFLKMLMDGIGRNWREFEQEHPNDPERQLREWILYMEMISTDEFGDSEECQLARATVNLIRAEKNPLLAQVEAFWQAERKQIARLCEAAKFRDPPGLADKLILLVQGARNERTAYGYKGPSRMLSEAGDDLMVVHGATRKLPLELD